MCAAGVPQTLRAIGTLSLPILSNVIRRPKSLGTILLGIAKLRAGGCLSYFR